VTLVEGDMRDFELGRQFALIFIGANSLLHLHRVDELMSCFAAIRRHLLPGGVFAFDVYKPSVALLARPRGTRYVVRRGQHPAHGEVVLEETVDYDAATQVNRIVWYFSSAAEKDLVVVPLALRCIFPQELPLLLDSGGFDLEARYGDFDGAPFTSASQHQVCICRART
jgi:hypothetical protein